ncbi:MAG TPA: hypothetical protein VMU26_02780 [Candidatus Polarisedimenticolia bacterium]|nr:hypothetical protein [Candidatus Polarisedimenticolia bacterium]
MAADTRHLIRDMSQANPLWGAPRIHGELLKLGIEVAQPTVAKYLRGARKPPSQTWRTFLTNHLEQMASIDFFVLPPATFRVLFVFVVLSHARRRVLHFQVTDHPNQHWTMQQIREAFPWDQGCRYLLRDRDATDRHGAASLKWTNQAPFQAVEHFGRNGLGDCKSDEKWKTKHPCVAEAEPAKPRTAIPGDEDKASSALSEQELPNRAARIRSLT